MNQTAVGPDLLDDVWPALVTRGVEEWRNARAFILTDRLVVYVRDQQTGAVRRDLEVFGTPARDTPRHGWTVGEYVIGLDTGGGCGCGNPLRKLSWLDAVQ